MGWHWKLLTKSLLPLISEVKDYVSILFDWW